MTEVPANDLSFVLQAIVVLESAVTEAREKIDDPAALGEILASLSALVGETMPHLVGSDLSAAEVAQIAQIKGQIADLERTVSARSLVLSGFPPYLKGMIEG
jgi:hypothetical protein